jgi:hypothetical protein
MSRRIVEQKPTQDASGSEYTQAKLADPEIVASTPETVTVTWGEELFSPVQYNSCRVGPFSFTTPVRVGETAGQALLRAHADLRDHVNIVRTEKVKAFRLALGELGIVRG